jgi:hypothetical protein
VPPAWGAAGSSVDQSCRLTECRTMNTYDVWVLVESRQSLLCGSPRQILPTSPFHPVEMRSSLEVLQEANRHSGK